MFIPNLSKLFNAFPKIHKHVKLNDPIPVTRTAVFLHTQTRRYKTIQQYYTDTTILYWHNTILTQQYYTDTTVLYWRNSTILTQQHYWHNNTILTQHYTDTTILYWHNTILTQQHYTDTILYWHLLLPSPFTLNTLKQLSPHLCPSIPRYLTIRITTNNCLHNCLHYHWHWQVPDSLSLSLYLFFHTNLSLTQTSHWQFPPWPSLLDPQYFCVYFIFYLFQ